MPELPTTSARALELMNFAGRLKLTPLQIDFVLALVADAKHNQTKAAIQAGASRKIAHIWASKTLKLAKVKEFLAKVTEAATERARGRALTSPEVRRFEQALMESAEHQLRLSRIGRADIGRHLTIDQDGNVQVRIDPDYADTIREIRVEERADKDGFRRCPRGRLKPNGYERSIDFQAQVSAAATSTSDIALVATIACSPEWKGSGLSFAGSSITGAFS